MEALLNWISENVGSIWAWFLGYLSLYGVSIVGLVIALITSKVKNFNYQTKLEELGITLKEEQAANIEKLRTEILNSLQEYKEQIVMNNNISNEERKQVLIEIKEAAEEKNAIIEKFNMEDCVKELN